MSRSKKNWDHLVDFFGNYLPFDQMFEENDKGELIFKEPKGEKGEEGEKGRRGFRGRPGNDGSDGIDGNDGEKGDEGEKGTALGFLYWMGEVPERSDLPEPGPGTEGHVYRVALTGYYYISDGNGNYTEITTGIEAIEGEKGTPGEKGLKGTKGDIGPAGPKLTWDDLLPDEQESLKGDKGLKGDSAFDQAVKGGFKGTETEFLESLKGDKGEDGKDFEFSDFTPDQLKGLEGGKGDKGDQGKFITVIGNTNPGEDPNAFPINYPCSVEGNALIDPSNGHLWICDGNGTWIDGGQLQGPKGDKGKEGISAYDSYLKGTTDSPPKTETEWADGLKGEKGGKGEKGEEAESLYDQAVKGGFKGTEVEYLESLKGQKGQKGLGGDTAYDNAVKGGYKGTETEYYESLKGDKGDEGPALDYDGLTQEQLKGLTGPKGQKGADSSISEAPQDSNFYGRYNASWQKVIPLDLMQLPPF